ncbi:hypothetical protein FB451DRAFT_553537 [Mycena latifolia]|nr:hypothetical protein FB451DRAFT_553537 [Mycena latifolia]
MPLSKHTTLIIAIAAASVAAVLAVLVLYRVLRRPPKQVPLPPKQELARYREQHIHDPESRPPTWYNSASLSAPPSEAYAASRSSLIPGDSRGGSPFRHSSLNISESPSDDVFSSAPMPLPLQLPHLPFDTSSTSLSTSETDSPPSSSPRLASDSPFSHTQSPRHPRSASASSRPHPRARPLSVGSSTSRNSRAIRGVPHGPHSQVQIVLPAPLAFTDVSENSPALERRRPVGPNGSSLRRQPSPQISEEIF